MWFFNELSVKYNVARMRVGLPLGKGGPIPPVKGLVRINGGASQVHQGSKGGEPKSKLSVCMELCHPGGSQRRIAAPLNPPQKSRSVSGI